MAINVQELTEKALCLSSEDRALLADRLVESLDPAEAGEIHLLWAKEAQRRLEQLRSGEVQAIPGEEVIKELREKYQR